MKNCLSSTQNFTDRIIGTSPTCLSRWWSRRPSTTVSGSTQPRWWSWGSSRQTETSARWSSSTRTSAWTARSTKTSSRSTSCLGSGQIIARVNMSTSRTARCVTRACRHPSSWPRREWSSGQSQCGPLRAWIWTTWLCNLVLIGQASQPGQAHQQGHTEEGHHGYLGGHGRRLSVARDRPLPKEAGESAWRGGPTLFKIFLIIPRYMSAMQKLFLTI